MFLNGWGGYPDRKKKTTTHDCKRQLETGMNGTRQIWFWVGGLVVFIALLSQLSEILMPFVAGMAVAYFLDPLADRLEAWKLSRALSTTIILLSFFAVFGLIIVILFPIVEAQVLSFVEVLPGLIDRFRTFVDPYLNNLKTMLPAGIIEQAGQSAGSVTARSAKILSDVLSGIWSGGIQLVNVLSLIVITPVVAFYLLRDWDILIDRIDHWLPRKHAPVIREQCLAIDRILAGFVRGQASVCLVLATWYGFWLSVVGLPSGLLVGIATGLISFVPYVGAAIGLAVGTFIAGFYFQDISSVLLVMAVFISGQTLESYVLTPKLVGDRVGLHPLWIIFALMAGGVLFGFTGVLLALPVSAVIGVLVRFALDRYLDSRYYNGGDGTPE